MSELLEFKNITKSFPGVLALDDVSFTAHRGEVTALVGENGAGKSTLLKILNGDYQHDSGQYLIDHQEKNFANPREAISAGVSVIYQERQIIPYLSVAENIFMEDIPAGRLGLVNFGELNAKAQEIIDEFRLPFKATVRVRDLSVAFQQMVEIMKAYRRHPAIIAFDEPTASLSDTEIDSLFEIINRLKNEMIILYVSHRMKEIFKITDQVVILKDGRFVRQEAVAAITEDEIIRGMVGRDLGDIFHSLSRNKRIGEVIFRAENLRGDNVRNVSFEVRAGEIVGFAGLVGAGRTETMRAIFGADKREGGAVRLMGKELNIRFPEDAIASGIGLCPEDRKDQGIFSIRAVRDNISVVMLRSLLRRGFIDRKAESSMAEQGVRQLNIRTPSIHKRIGELSGGNQQKTIFARWIAANPKLLILDEPTKGIDVGSKSEIYQIICDLAKQGIGIIFISSELPEILGLCDRIVVMCQGRITGELMREEASDHKVLTLAMADMLEGQTA
ncbi:MAG: sugar ABC transporter ATP-binding protein [Treponema sp.]|jgi:ABC-type sugar transport system ATPase subunit|nr:sugar ABC transporter ATP-binding protein [Treponema sp.]